MRGIAWFGSLRVAPLLFADDAVLFIWSSQQNVRALYQEEPIQIRDQSSLNQKKVGALLQVTPKLHQMCMHCVFAPVWQPS